MGKEGSRQNSIVEVKWWKWKGRGGEEMGRYVIWKGRGWRRMGRMGVNGMEWVETEGNEVANGRSD